MYPLNLTPFYIFWQTSSYFIYPSGKITLAAQLLIHCTPSEQITTSLLHHFFTFGSSTLTSFYHLWTLINPPPNLNTTLSP